MNRAFAILCDLDGVVWLARRPLPGAAEAISKLRSSGHRVVFVTNNSYATVAEQEQNLLDVGIPARGDVVTSAMAAASLLEVGMKVLVCGGPGLVEAVRLQRAEPIEMSQVEANHGHIDAVVVGFHRTFDYEGLRRASAEIRRGARFIASNDDPTYPTPEGPIPGGGSIVAAVATASGRNPEIAGKPHAAMASLVKSLVPNLDGMTVMIGDRPSTDGSFAASLGCRFALVRSDVSREETDGRSIRSVPAFVADFEGASLRDVSEGILNSV